ncbi:DUF2478 domain-containing protein [Celeribacter sp.]|uniref:DUF2478 domain-containing protein n=1 Tax=Celeribacter sp. TaxID=1890673 RepID=UPI003A925011
MLAVVSGQGQGETDAILRAVAASLRDQGLRVAGAVQVNTDRAGSSMCDMDLHILSSGTLVRISQSLGPHARGCRLDPDGLERAVAAVEADMATCSPALLIINKFGKQEVEGRGFRDVIGMALAEGVPVIVGVSPDKRAAFDAFCDGLATPVAADVASILDWVMIQVAAE